MEADFLRFTLSDGAGAVVMEAAPGGEGQSLRIEWIDLVSLAGRFDPCMWAGATAARRATLTGRGATMARPLRTGPARSPCSRTFRC